MLGAGPARSAALPRPPLLSRRRPLLSAPPSAKSTRGSFPAEPRLALGRWCFRVWFWSSLWEEPWGRAPPIGRRLFQKPTWFCWVQPAPFPRSPSAHPLGRESISACPGLSRGGPRPLRPAQKWGCGARRPRPQAGIREDQVSSIFLVRTQGVLCQSLAVRRTQTSPRRRGMGAPAPQICNREIRLVWGFGRSTSPTGPRA